MVRHILSQETPVQFSHRGSAVIIIKHRKNSRSGTGSFLLLDSEFRKFGPLQERGGFHVGQAEDISL